MSLTLLPPPGIFSYSVVSSSPHMRVNAYFYYMLLCCVLLISLVSVGEGNMGVGWEKESEGRM